MKVEKNNFCCLVRSTWVGRTFMLHTRLIFSVRLRGSGGEERLTAASSSLLSLASSFLRRPAEERASLLRLVSVPSDCLSPSRWKTNRKRDTDTSQTASQPAAPLCLRHYSFSIIIISSLVLTLVVL